MHALIVTTEGLSNTRSLVITTANAFRVDAAAVALRMMHLWIAKNPKGACTQEASTNTPRQAQYVVSAQKTYFRYFNRVELDCTGEEGQTMCQIRSTSS